MDKILLIIQREYLSRVRKKSFILMTIIGPLLLVGVVFIQFWIRALPEEKQKLLVIDESGLIKNAIPNHKNLMFFYGGTSITSARKDFYNGDKDIIIYIPANILEANTVQLFYKKQAPLSTKIYIENAVKSRLEDLKLIASGISRNQIAQLKPDITLTESRLEPDGNQKRQSSEVSMILGFVAGLLIYMFIFLYGQQVMRGVIEEKTSRIVEVIISSVKPFQLMMGKIIGVALVGLTQFLLWIALSATGISVIGNLMADKTVDFVETEQTFKSNIPQNADFRESDSRQRSEIMQSFLGMVNFPVMISCFLIYFLFGYLLYGALFAAVAAAVDSEADTQQFMIPLTIPLVLAITVSQSLMTNPGSPIAFWFSIIPLTSPVVMMMRIPFGVPYYEIAISMILLIAGFIFFTWLSAKIYRTGILMYGKKSSYKELWKWLFYKE